MAQDHDVAPARTPGKATLAPSHAGQQQQPAASASAFDGAQWEDIPAHEHGAHGHDAHGDKSKAANDAGVESGGIHIITRAGLRHLLHGGAKGRDAAHTLYNNPDAYVVLKEGQQLPKGWKANATILFPSYAEFNAAHEAGRIPHDIKAVVYDNEHWAQTPADEKTHAVHYAKLFGELAHKLGMKFLAAPTQKWFAADARFADVIDLQLQSRETHTRSYARAVKHDVNLAHKFNPNEDVVAQISSNKNHLDPAHTGNLAPGIKDAEGDILNNEGAGLAGFWGYLYQRNGRSVRAGQKILEDLAAHESEDQQKGGAGKHDPHGKHDKGGGGAK